MNRFGSFFRPLVWFAALLLAALVAGCVSTNCVETPVPLSGWFIVNTGKVGLTAEGLIPANGSCTVTVQVTAPAAGSYVNSLPAGALQTDHGNSAAPATATLTVN